MPTNKQLLAQQIAEAVGAGKTVALETVDFNDPNRPKTCLEVDFPILPVNQVAVIEGNAGKPIYQMSKWWARRRSSVFRSMLIAAATKAPNDPTHAAKLVWDNYYANHQKKGAFKHLKVADIFMGGGTTLVEGSRLGMQMFGNDLNPVAWFVVKQEFAKVDLDEVKRLLADIEAEVKPQIMPYYYCDGPNGEKGKWTHIPTGRIEGPDFDPLNLTIEQRREYKYEGPEIIYTFWAKHGPCQVTGCGHRTPIMTSPVMAVKTLTVKHWEHTCTNCHTDFHVEDAAARMAPEVPLYVASQEYPYSVLDPQRGVVCPNCAHAAMVKLGKGKNKKIELSLLVHPQWLAGSSKSDANSQPFGGSAQDDAASTARWNKARAAKIRLLEVRGPLPETVTCPETNATFKTGKDGGTVSKKSSFTCGHCGTVQDVLASMTAFGKSGPMALYALQGYSSSLDKHGNPYGGRFFLSADESVARQFDAAHAEWEARKEKDLAKYWPREAVPEGFKTSYQRIPEHGYPHFYEMFNPRQLLVHTQLLRSILEAGGERYSWAAREFVLGAFQQYLRNQCMFSFWHIKLDKLAPSMSNNNYHPKANVVEVGVFPPMGYGPWSSTIEVLTKGLIWKQQPWELVPTAIIRKIAPQLADQVNGMSEKVNPGDCMTFAQLFQASSTDLRCYDSESIDLVITDPPFGNNIQYSELADFFYVWLRKALLERYPDQFAGELTPKAVEVVTNPVREKQDPDGFYKRLLTASWLEVFRILKCGGLLAFTFHHSEDEPWAAVLESLFEAGFYLEAAYPIRSDETKGEGAKPGTFGSQLIEYDIIHVCRKRTEDPKPVSWGRMRREVLGDVHQLQGLLEHHAKDGLPAADLQVIRRGKALEYYSRHYGKVYVDEGRPITVKDALVGINQLIDEDANRVQEPPPVTAEPITRQFLRIFDSKTEVARDQIQKFMKGSGSTPDEFEERGWCSEKNKVFTLVNPLDFARDWHGRHKRKLTSDLDQALVLIGACYDGSGINAADTLKNENFKPHAALKALLEWEFKKGATQTIRNAASRALTIYNGWAAAHQQQVRQMEMFSEGTD
jgi:putative DNA methylase